MVEGVQYGGESVKKGDPLGACCRPAATFWHNLFFSCDVGMRWRWLQGLINSTVIDLGTRLGGDCFQRLDNDHMPNGIEGSVTSVA